MCLQIILALQWFKEEVNSAIIKKIQQSTCQKNLIYVTMSFQTFFQQKILSKRDVQHKQFLEDLGLLIVKKLFPYAICWKSMVEAI
jgi:hypothetical protein